MKNLLFPLAACALGLFAADYLFDLDVPELLQGFGNFLLSLFSVTKH